MWIVLAAAISFLPFKVATLASGLTGLSFIPFIIASLIGRAIRFYAVAALVYFFGAQIRFFIDRYFNLLSFLLVGFIILFVAIMEYGQ